MLRRFGEIVDEQMKSLGYETGVKEWSAVWLWKDIVGSSLASVSRADKVRGHVLYVSVKSSSWAHHLSLMKRQFLEKMNAALGDNVLKDIKFTVTYYSQRPTYEQSIAKWKNGPDPDLDLSDVSLSEDVLDEIRRNASSIPDPHLRDLFEKTQLADKKRKERMAKRGGCKCQVCGVLLEVPGICPVCENQQRLKS